jgi:T5orf172 domain
MQEEEQYFAYGNIECPSGLTLRSRPSSRRIGNCIQCSPASIAFATLHYISSFVYVAGSLDGHLIKIGSSTAADNRLYTANLVGYASCSDWERLFCINVQQGARIESDVQSKLRPYQRQINFMRSGTRQTARECFACSYQQAYSQLTTTLRSCGELEKAWQAERAILENYEFNKF